MADFRPQSSQVIVACDFFVVVTATFRTLYVFVLMELGTRRVLHHNVTTHPTAEWTLQQFREGCPVSMLIDSPFMIATASFSEEVDEQLGAMGLHVMKTPVRAPKANSFRERFGGTMRGECLDFPIPFNERHLRLVLKIWIAHFNHSRPHMSLGPGIPAALHPQPPQSIHRQRIASGHASRRATVLGGLHHEYWIEKIAA